MIQELCDTEEKYQEAFDAAKEAIEMRIYLWEGIHKNLWEDFCIFLISTITIKWLLT